MAASFSWNDALRQGVTNFRNQIYGLATGEPAPGTYDRAVRDLLRQNTLTALGRQGKTLTPQEQAQFQLGLERSAAEMRQELETKGLTDRLPIIAGAARLRSDIDSEAYDRRIEADTGAFSSRARVAGEEARQTEIARGGIQQGLITAAADAQGRVAGENYRTYAGNILGGPLLPFQERTFDRSAGIRENALNRMFALQEQAQQANIDLARRYADQDLAQNSGIGGFLNRFLMPVAQIALAFT